ncbi:N-(5'-phosphoribosyl)anthranilate isomerase [Aquisphaera giovannonii]|uniref:N-(5'-phosphoribosyl)anthranilate isomerase n=1 Tax=Aquisphaera giovannonii TaxID=406548 RepID=A0A5B9VXZ6_9BACT|nr:phosphoribosylanthranilate isomerase [Aquisphaera giovannonii]QEH33019.1 N-(5'-phosphoribosyl)anthranilate isomerase [Aquisphaera giovannonii]
MELSPTLPTGAAPAVLVKICGLTRADEAASCIAAGADWIGLNFHPGSPRFLDPDRSGEIVSAIGSPERAVGLFVNRPAAEVARVAARLGISTVQLHGDEPPEDLVALTHLRIVRAFRLGRPEDVEAMAGYLDRARSLGRVPDAVLVDALVAGVAGGTGTVVAGPVLDRLASMATSDSLPPMILAGGLNPENVRGRVDRVRPWMVDVASGVESGPGRKDPRLVAAFIRAARGEPRERPGQPVDKGSGAD